MSTTDPKRPTSSGLPEQVGSATNSAADGTSPDEKIEFELTGQHQVIVVPTADATGQHQAIRVVRKTLPTVRPWSVLVFLVAALVTFLAVSQLRGPDRFREQLNSESEGDLTRILANLSSESTALQQELGSLKVDLANLQNNSQDENAASDEATAQLNALKVLAGTVPVTGPGLEMVVDDPQNQVTYDSLVDAVQELRDAGAEALSINGRRIGVASAFTQAGGKISLDGVVLPTPYSLSAIGPAATMEGGLKIPGGSLDSLRARNGVTVDVHRNSSINMPALEKPPTFQAARPVG